MNFVLSPVLGWAGSLIVIALIGAILVWMTVRFAHNHSHSDITTGMLIRRWCIGVSLIAMLLGPSTYALTTTRAVNATDVFIAVDITGSMAVSDASYGGEKSITRIRAARNAVYDIVEQYSDASFTGITFGSTASVSVPSTPDSYAVRNWADTLTTEPTTASAGSSLDTPLNILTTQMKKTLENHPQDTIVAFLITDGETTSGESTRSFSVLRAYIKNKNATVIGVGSSKGGKIPSTKTGITAGKNSKDSTFSEGWVQDPDTKKDGISKLDADSLQTIADQLSGNFFIASTSKTVAHSSNAQASSQYRISSTTRNGTRIVPLIWPIAIVASIVTLGELIAWWLTSRKLIVL